MNALDRIPAFLWTMVDIPFWEIAIRSTLVIAIAALACRLLARQSAALRHRVWVLGLAASLLAPIASLLLPQYTLAVLPSALNPSGTSIAAGLASTSPRSAGASFVPEAAGEFAAGGDLPSEANAASDAALPVAVPGAAELPAARTRTPGLQHVLVLVWLLGTAIGSALLVISLIRQSIRLSRLRRIEDSGWADSVARAARAIGLSRPIVALESPEACVPAVVGVLAPRLVMPANWRDWSGAQRQCVLLHELAHVKRRDVVAQLLGRLALVAYWFNPLVWHAASQLQAERELASDDCVLLSGQTASTYAEQLLSTLRSCRTLRPLLGVAMAHSARLDQRVLAILDPQRRREGVSSRLALVLSCGVGVIVAALGAVTLTAPLALAAPPAEAQAAPAGNLGPVWKVDVAIEYPGTLPVSVAFSADGEVLLTGDTAGEVMALIFADGEPLWRWKAKVEGSHAAVAFAADQEQVYATTEHGLRILDAASGKEQGRIEARDSRPTAIGVFPEQKLAEEHTRLQVALGTPRGYLVKSWAEGRLADTVGTLETSTVPDGAQPPDEAAVPLAVDPEGRSAIMTGPIDATGEVGGVKGKNVLWAYVCGDYGEGSPGNRVMPGHKATVVSAAWAKEGKTAVTGDDDGRVIVWDTKTMKEVRRLELGGRVAALAISHDAARTAAYVLGEQGKVFVWETAQPPDAMQPIHTELADFGGPQAYASLTFTPNGERLAGCAIDKRWLSRLGELTGKVRVWQLASAPKAQLPPKHAFIKPLPPGSRPHFAILDNHSLLVPAAKEGAVDLRRVDDGEIQARIVLGKFTLGGLKLSADRQWLALEQHPARDVRGGERERTFDVGIYQSPLQHKSTIGSCSQLLDIASGGQVVAVVREKQIELWDIATAKRLKAAPFQHERIDAARFSPDGKLLAVSDRNRLVLWHWEAGGHERIDLGRSVGSLAFSPNGRFLAEGPTPRSDIQIRDLDSRQIVQTLANGAKRSMNVPRLVYAQSGRVLIACDNLTFTEEVAVPHRIHLWDLADGSLAHQLAVPDGLPLSFDVSPNGRHLVAMLEVKNGLALSGWRLDGQDAAEHPAAAPPAAAQPR